MSQNSNCCDQPATTKLPIRSIGFPMHGVSIDVDTSAIQPCRCEIATPEKSGLVPEGGRPGQVYAVDEEGQTYGWRGLDELVSQIARHEELVNRLVYRLCEFYSFRHPDLRAGFQPAEGVLLENAAELYPEAWTYLQTEAGQKLCVSEEEWQAMNHAVWHTNADGTEVGWEGIGGVPFYVQDLEDGTLRLPDLRGMYAETAGFDGLEVGGAHGDAIRNITGSFGLNKRKDNETGVAGICEGLPANAGAKADDSAALNPYAGVTLNAARQVPTANKNQPRAWGALACVYLGIRRKLSGPAAPESGRLSESPCFHPA